MKFYNWLEGCAGENISHEPLLLQGFIKPYLQFVGYLHNEKENEKCSALHCIV